MKQKRYLKILIAILCLPFLGCSNVFQNMANKTSDEALFEDVQTLMDQQNWDEAITKFGSMSSEFRTRSDVIEAWAGVYAGKCGLIFGDYFAALTNANVGSTTIFAFLMNAWTGKTVNPTYCTMAQTKLEEISTVPTSRTNGQNLFLAILGMVKIGVYLRNYADHDGTGNLGDGTAEINVCTADASSPPAGTYVPDAAVTEIVTGLGLITTNMSYLTAVLSNNSITGALDTLNTVCGSFPGACGKTSPSAVTSSDRDTFRDLLKTSGTNPTAPLGVGNCVDPAVVPCC